MIVKNIDSENQLIFTGNKEGDLNTICSELGYLRKDGTYYKTLTIDRNYNYYPSNSDISISAIKLYYKNVTTIILDKFSECMINGNDISKLIKLLNRYGTNHSVKINGVTFDGPLNQSANDIITSDDKKITIGDTTNSNNDIRNMHNFIHKMSMDNGRMLYPILRRYTNTLHLFKGNKSLLTGYVKLSDYLYTLKMPITGIKKLMGGSDSDYNIMLNSNIVKIEITNITNGRIEYNVDFNGSLTTNINTGKYDPYILFTTSPITLQNQKLPFQVVSMNGIKIFVSPLLFSNRDVLAKLKGGINLLS